MTSDECPDWCRHNPGHGDANHEARRVQIPLDTVDEAGALRTERLTLLMSRPVGPGETSLWIGADEPGGQYLRLTPESAERLADAIAIYLTTQS